MEKVGLKGAQKDAQSNGNSGPDLQLVWETAGRLEQDAEREEACRNALQVGNGL